MKKEFEVHYYNNPTGKKKEWSHKLSEKWDFLEEKYCPNCGEKGVWASNKYDYYADNEHICTECEYSFHMPFSGSIGKDETGLQRLQQLKSEQADHLTLGNRLSDHFGIFLFQLGFYGV